MAATRAAIRLLTDEPELVEHLWDNTRYLKGHLADFGLDTGKSQTPITPVMLGDAATAHHFSDRLRELGVFVRSVAFPTVPRDTARLRVMVSAAHSRQDLDEAADAFRVAAAELGLR